MRDHRNIVFVLYGSCNGNGTWTSTHTLTGQQTVLEFLVYVLAVVRRDVDEAWVKLLQTVDGAEQSCCSIALEWGQYLEGESSLLSFLI